MKYSEYIEKNPSPKDLRGKDLTEPKLIKISQSKLAYLKYLSIYNGSFSKVLDISIDILIEKIENNEINPKRLI